MDLTGTFQPHLFLGYISLSWVLSHSSWFYTGNIVNRLRVLCLRHNRYLTFPPGALHWFDGCKNSPALLHSVNLSLPDGDIVGCCESWDLPAPSSVIVWTVALVCSFYSMYVTVRTSSRLTLLLIDSAAGLLTIDMYWCVILAYILQPTSATRWRSLYISSWLSSSVHERIVHASDCVFVFP